MHFKPLWRVGVERTLATACRTVPEGSLSFGLRAAAFNVSSHLPKRALVNAGEVVLQTGCWRTETLVGWSQAVGSEGHVVAVEADPTNVEVLRIEAQRRSLDNVSIVQRAVWNEETTVDLQVSQHSRRNKLRDASTYSPRQTQDNYDSEIEVPADTIDAILEGVGQGYPDHVHLTVSGAEREAIEGMSETLGQPGARVFVRAILNDESSDALMNDVVADTLREKRLRVTKARTEPHRGGGGNVYATQI